MKMKLFLAILFAVFSLPLFAQGGGIKGVVVSRAGRALIDDAKVTLLGVTPRTVYTEKGAFEFRDVAPGNYQLLFEAGDFQPMQVGVTVDKTVKDLNFISLVPEAMNRAVDDADFSEFDTESDNGSQSMPVVLSASKDIFDNIAGYKFSAARFRTRGYDNGMASVYLNGVYLNDAMSGYTPWSLWSGLNDATRNQELSSGVAISDYGVGGVNGTTNINARASQMRKGFRASIVNANNMYRFRVMASYASGENEKGWSYALAASTRQGGNDWVKGVYYNSWSYFLSVEKKIDPFNRLAFTFFGAPSQRGAQTASTQEVYDLVGSNFYNANWGYQDGKKRNARVRNSHEPVAMLNYFYQPSNKLNLMATVSYRFGKNGYSALDWYDAQDPRPDYYRYLPSYYRSDDESKNNPYLAAYVTEGWKSNWDVRQINWDRLYDVNYNSVLNPDREYWGNPEIAEGTTRSKYVLEERHTDQKDFNAKVQLVSMVKENSKISAGFEFRQNKTEYYKKIKDLLGGDYWLDVDQFAERDFGSGNAIQNNLNTPNRLVQKGDKYGYDYFAHLLNEKLWATYRFNKANFEGYVGLEGGHTTFWRDGVYKKGLFPDNSEGKSAKQRFWTYTLKAGLTYKITGNQMVYANFAYLHQAPYFQDAFVSPRTRNSVVPNLTTEKVLSADLNYALRMAGFRVRLTGYYTKIKDQTNLISFYDDQNRAYTNFAMSGIDQTHVGMELGVSVPLIAGIEAQGAFSYGNYYYTSNPYVTQTVDNSEAVIANTRVYWKDMKVATTPQTAASIGLNYRGPHNIYAGLDLNYYARMYQSMNPLYRTDQALVNYDMFEPDVREEMIRTMRNQEEFDHSFILNANIGKSWYIQRKYNLGFSLEVKNILNNKDTKTGGYEQMRFKKNELNGKTYYTRFDSKYFYMFGTTYYLNIYFRF